MGLSSSVRVNWRPEPTAALPIRIPRRWFGQGGGSYDLQLPLRWAAFPLGWWPIDVPLAACWQDISRANGAPSATWRIEILPGSLLSTSSGSAVWGSNILDILLPQDVNAVAEQLPGGFNLPTRLALLQRNVRHAVGSVAPYAQNVIVKRDAVLEKSDRFLARLAAVHFRTRLDCRRPNRDWLPPAGTSDDVVAWYIRNRENEVVFQLVSATAALREIMRDGFEACNGHESIRVVKSGLRGYVLALADCAVRSLLAESIAVDQSGVALAAKPIDLVLFGLSVGTLLVLANTLPEEPGATSRVAAGPLQAVARPGSNGAGDHDPESDAAHSTRTGTFLGATRPGGSITIARAAALDDDTFLVNPLEASVDSDPLRKDALAIAQPVDQRLRPLRPMRRSVAELPAPHDSDATTLDEGSTGASTSASTAALRERASTLGNDADPVTPPPLHGSAENLLAQSSSPTPPNNDDASTRAQSPMDNPQPVTEMGEEVRLQLERVEAAAAARAASQANIMRLQFKVMKEAS